MKKSTTFIFTAIFLLIINTGLSNAFFVPEYEKQPRYEKLPDFKRFERQQKQIDREKTNYQKNKKTPSAQFKNLKNNYEVESYVLVNGVFSPVYKKKEIKQPQPTQQQNYTTDHPQVIKIAQPKETEAEAVKQKLVQAVEKHETKIEEKQEEYVEDNYALEIAADTIDPSAPKYKNIYNQYLLDLKAFRKTGKFPKNQSLEYSLAQFKSNKPMVLYSNYL